MLFLSALMASKVDGCNFVDCDIHADKDQNGLLSEFLCAFFCGWSREQL